MLSILAKSNDYSRSSRSPLRAEFSGKAVHELCYVSKVTNENGSNWQSLYNDAAAESDPIRLLDKIEAAQKAIGNRLADGFARSESD